MKNPWLIGGSLVVAGALVTSVWSYNQSLGRREPLIATNTPASVTVNPFPLSGFARENKLRFYLIDWDTMNFTLNLSGADHSFSVSDGQHADTDFNVKSGDTVNVTIAFAQGTKPYGWTVPTDPATRNCQSKTAPVIAAAQAAGETVISTECWNDDNSGDDPYDDFEVVVTQLGGTPASPSPSPSPNPNGIICDGGGSFTTSSGKQYCVINKGIDHSLMVSACGQYGTWASILDDESKQDILDIIAKIKTAAGQLASANASCASFSACDLWVSDSCDAFAAKYGKTDNTLYSDDTWLSATLKIDCSTVSMGFNITPASRVGYLNDTGLDTKGGGDDKGGGAVCQLASLTPSPSPSPSPVPSASPQASASPSPETSASPSPAPSSAPSQPDTGTPTALTVGAVATIVVITLIKVMGLI